MTEDLRERTGRDAMPRWLSGVLAGLVGGLAALLVQRLIFPPPALAQVDLAALVTAHIRDAGRTDLPQDQRAREAARFATRLHSETARLANEYHTILLAAPAVVAGVPDLTPVLRRRIEEDHP